MSGRGPVALLMASTWPPGAPQKQEVGPTRRGERGLQRKPRGRRMGPPGGSWCPGAPLVSPLVASWSHLGLCEP